MSSKLNGTGTLGDTLRSVNPEGNQRAPLNDVDSGNAHKPEHDDKNIGNFEFLHVKSTQHASHFQSHWKSSHFHLLAKTRGSGVGGGHICLAREKVSI